MPDQKGMNHFKPIALSSLSAILFCLGWHQNFGIIFLSVAFVPLLILEDLIQGKKFSSSYTINLYAFIIFLFFIGCTTYWLVKYSFFGALTVWGLQAVLWTLVFYGFHLTKKHFGTQVGYLAFLAYFMAFEYYNLCIDWGWSWTNLGNGLAAFTQSIQWYEYTGIAGGTFWILLLNLWVFILVKKYHLNQSLPKKECLVILFLWLFPIGISYALLLQHQFPSKQLKESIAIFQPNINSYQNKFKAFNDENLENQISYIRPLLKTLNNQTYDLMILPETVFPYVSNIDTDFHHPANFLKNHLKADGKLIFGMYLTNKKNQKYNAVVSVNAEDNVSYHLKRRLVPGIEYFPLWKGSEKLFHKKYYTKPKKKIVTNENITYPTAICYESVFGADIAIQSRFGNKAILIATNDGWFDNTTLIKQHLNIAKLRAIENRRYVLRAANSGISAVINHYGVVEKYLPNIEAGVLEYTIPREFDQSTFYQNYPDIVYRIFSLIAIILLLYTFVAQFTHNFKFKKLGFQ